MSNNKNKKSQATEILRYLKKNKKKGLTSMQAFELFGVTRLSAKIFELKKRGYVIDCIREKTVTRFGNPCSYGRYVLVSEPSENE